MRVALVRLSALGAVAAVVLGARHTWPDLGHERSHLTGAQAARAAAVHEGMPPALFDRWKAELRPGQRWWINITPGARKSLPFHGAGYHPYAVFWLLPNLPARTKSEADVIFVLKGPT